MSDQNLDKTSEASEDREDVSGYGLDIGGMGVPAPTPPYEGGGEKKSSATDPPSYPATTPPGSGTTTTPTTSDKPADW